MVALNCSNVELQHTRKHLELLSCQVLKFDLPGRSVSKNYLEPVQDVVSFIVRVLFLGNCKCIQTLLKHKPINEACFKLHEKK